ncbi:hemerythrin domain-containing protein, partial [Nostocoides japonicum]|uniref:hemerythrin domain-containing protein n=1 Tax=Nostocoides japonicum TaxID=99481 RepID=UPI00065C08D0
MDASADQPVLDLLTESLAGQHARIRELFREVQRATDPEATEQVFSDLVRFLAIHETGEQVALHGAAAVQTGRDRIHEEEAAVQLIERLEDLGPRSSSFHIQLDLLAEAVDRHARTEESVELPLFLAAADASDVARLVGILRLVEECAADRAPTASVPHAG